MKYYKVWTKQLSDYKERSHIVAANSEIEAWEFMEKFCVAHEEVVGAGEFKLKSLKRRKKTLFC